MDLKIQDNKKNEITFQIIETFRISFTGKSPGINYNEPIILVGSTHFENSSSVT